MKISFGLFFFAVLTCTSSIGNALYVYIKPDDGSLVPLRTARDYFAFEAANVDTHLLWPDNSYNQASSDESTCSDTIDTQYSEVDNSYSIVRWYTIEDKFGDISVATVVSITNLTTFAGYAHGLGTWSDSPSCSDVMSRILTNVVSPLQSKILVFMSPNELTYEENGMSVSILCNDSVCTSDSLISLLRLSGNSLENIKLLDFFPSEN